MISALAAPAGCAGGGSATARGPARPRRPDATPRGSFEVIIRVGVSSQAWGLRGGTGEPAGPRPGAWVPPALHPPAARRVALTSPRQAASLRDDVEGVSRAGG